MSTFTQPLVVAVSPDLATEALDLRWIDGRRWLLLQPFTFASQVLERIICVPAGFITDFASIPRGLWNLLPPTGKYGKAAVLHDYLYRTPGQASRGDADRVLKEAMEVLRVGRLARWVIYAGVRLGGHWAYQC